MHACFEIIPWDVVPSDMFYFRGSFPLKKSILHFKLYCIRLFHFNTENFYLLQLIYWNIYCDHIRRLYFHYTLFTFFYRHCNSSFTLSTLLFSGILCGKFLLVSLLFKAREILQRKQNYKIQAQWNTAWFVLLNKSKVFLASNVLVTKGFNLLWWDSGRLLQSVEICFPFSALFYTIAIAF